MNGWDFVMDDLAVWIGRAIIAGAVLSGAFFGVVGSAHQLHEKLFPNPVTIRSCGRCLYGSVDPECSEHGDAGVVL